MLYYILGVLTGVVIMGFMFLALWLFRTPLNRTLNQAQSRLASKGSIIEPDNNELAAFLDSLKDEDTLP